MAVEVTYCIVNTEQRALLLRCLDAVARERAACRSRPRCWCSTTRRATAPRAPRARHPAVDELIRLDQRRGKGANDSTPAPARPRPILPAAQRGRRAAAGRDGGPAGRAGGRADAAAAGAELLGPAGERQPSAWRFPTPVGRAAGRARPAQRLRRAEPRRAHARRRLVAVGRPARPPRRRRADRLVRPGVLRPLRRGRLLQAAARRGLDRAVRARRPGGAPRAARRRDAARAPDRRAVPQPRPLHAQAPRPGGGARRARPDGVDLRGPLRARARRARPRPAPLPPARDRDAVPATAARASRRPPRSSTAARASNLAARGADAPTTTGRSWCCSCPPGSRRSPLRAPRRGAAGRARRGRGRARARLLRRARRPAGAASRARSRGARPSACGCPASRAPSPCSTPLQLPLAGALLSAIRRPSCGTWRGAYREADFALDLAGATDLAPGVGADGGRSASSPAGSAPSASADAAAAARTPRQHGADRQQRPRDGVLQERGVQPRVHDDRDEAGGHDRAVGIVAGAAAAAARAPPPAARGRPRGRSGPARRRR